MPKAEVVQPPWKMHIPSRLHCRECRRASSVAADQVDFTPMHDDVTWPRRPQVMALHLRNRAQKSHCCNQGQPSCLKACMHITMHVRHPSSLDLGTALGPWRLLLLLTMPLEAILQT